VTQDKPFNLRGGDSTQVAIFNRIQAIERIKFICGVDLRKKSKYYLYALDLEMYTKWYKNYPKDHKIDENWCKRAAEIVKDMEQDSQQYDKATELAGRVSQAYQQHESLPLKEPVEEKPSILRKLFNKLTEGGKDFKL